MLLWVVGVLFVLVVIALWKFAQFYRQMVELVTGINGCVYPSESLRRRLFTNRNRHFAFGNLGVVLEAIKPNLRVNTLACPTCGETDLFHFQRDSADHGKKLVNFGLDNVGDIRTGMALRLSNEVIHHFSDSKHAPGYVVWAYYFGLNDLGSLMELIGRHPEDTETLLQAFIRDKTRDCFQVLEVACAAAEADLKINLQSTFELFVEAERRVQGIQQHKQFKETLIELLANECGKMSFRVPFLSPLVLSYLEEDEWEAMNTELKRLIRIGMIWFWMFDISRFSEWSEGSKGILLEIKEFEPVRDDSRLLAEILFGPDKWVAGWKVYKLQTSRTNDSCDIVCKAIDALTHEELPNATWLLYEFNCKLPRCLLSRLLKTEAKPAVDTRD